MIEKKDKQLPEKNKIPWWIIALLILLAILYFTKSDFTKSDNLDKYNYCVNDCIYDLQSCLDYPYFLSDSYLKESDVSECLDDLESCMIDCEINYGTKFLFLFVSYTSSTPTASFYATWHGFPYMPILTLPF